MNRVRLAAADAASRTIASALLAVAVLLGLLAGGCGKPERDTAEHRRAAALRKQQMAAPPEAAEMLGAAARGGPSLDDEQRALVAARFGERTITLGDLARHFGSLPRNLQYAYLTPDRVRQFLDHVLDVELMAAEARRLGLDRDARVLLPAKAAMARAWLREELPEKEAIPPVTEEELRAEYAAHPERYAAPVVVHVTQLVTPTRAQAEALRAQLASEADAAPERRAERFRELVARHSVDDDSRGDRGDLPAIASDDPAPTLPRVVREAALALQRPGELSPVIELGTRYHILLLTERSGGELRSFDAAVAAVRSRLYQARQQAATERHVAALRAAADVRIDQDTLRRIAAEAPAPRAGDASGAPQGETP